MKLPSDCPYAAKPQEALAGDAHRCVACCRPLGWGPPIFSDEQFAELTRELLKTIDPETENIEATIHEAAIAKAACMWAEEPLCRSMRTETEVYRFTWRSSFDGDAVVRIGRQGDEIALRWVYRWFRIPSPDDAPPVQSPTPEDWARLQEALAAACFWMLDADEGPIVRGLDGSDWLIEGRRKDIFRAVSRWGPRGALRDLGKLLFEMAGSPLAEVRVY
jgi:hypothetical protein